VAGVVRTAEVEPLSRAEDHRPGENRRLLTGPTTATRKHPGQLRLGTRSQRLPRLRLTNGHKTTVARPPQATTPASFALPPQQRPRMCPSRPTTPPGAYAATARLARIARGVARLRQHSLTRTEASRGWIALRGL
jgi:hypothetical protein